MTATVLTGGELADRIREICAADEVDCAVAFWSGSSRDGLFPRWKKQQVRIICDISMGCNSKGSLEAYGAPKNPLLRVWDGLHSKVFISSAGAVIGSANASFNGLGRKDASPGNLEAGVFFEADSDGWKAASSFFQTLWDKPAPDLDQAQLDRAPILARDPGSTISKSGQNSTSVLERVLAYPSDFDGTLFVITGADISETVEKELNGAHLAARKGEEFEPADRELIVQDTARSLAKASDRVLMFWFGNEKRPELLAYYKGVRVSTAKYHAIYGVKGWRRFWKELSMDSPVKATALSRDVDVARKLCPSPNARRDGWVGTAHELADELRKLGYRPTL